MLFRSAITIELQQKHATTDSSQITAEVKHFLDKLHARSVLLYKDQAKDS